MWWCLRDNLKSGSNQRFAQLFGVTMVDDGFCFKTNLGDNKLQKN